MTDRSAAAWPFPLPAGEELPTPLPSVWPTGQRGPLAQLRDAGCVPGTDTDTERIPPAVAACAIAAYSRPGDLVVDPCCGAGTVLTEALRARRHALGLTNCARWWTLARANITATKTAGAWHDGSVLDAQPKVLGTIRAAALIGQVGLVLTAMRTESDALIGGGRDRIESSLARFAATLHYCEPLLRSGGRLVVVAQPRRGLDGTLVDLTSSVIAAAAAAGLEPIERCVALNAELRGARLVVRTSIADRRAVARVSIGGAPVALTAHHEVLVFGLASDVALAAARAFGIPPSTDDVAVAAVPDDGACLSGMRAA